MTKAIDIHTDSPEEYFSRVNERIEQGSSMASRLIQIQQIADSGDKHLARLVMAKKRFRRAIEQQDDVSASFEGRFMLALLYETIDTTFLSMNLLDFEQLELNSSADGLGIAGDSAAAVVRILSTLNAACAQALATERDLGLRIDFLTAIDEKEGLSYTEHPHWQNYIPNSIELSFQAYFSKAQSAVSDRLKQKPRFWREQTVAQYLDRKGYTALLQVLDRLEKASFV